MTASPDYLAAENAMLKGLLTACSSHLPSEWELTPTESKIMGALLSDRILDCEHMLQLLYWGQVRGDGEDDAEGLVRVFLHNLRQKLRPFGINVVCQRGVGYHLDPSGKQIVMRHI